MSPFNPFEKEGKAAHKTREKRAKGAEKAQESVKTASLLITENGAGKLFYRINNTVRKIYKTFKNNEFSFTNN